MMRTFSFVCAVAVAFCAPGAAAKSWSVKSPHARSEFVVRTTAGGGLEYKVLLHEGRGKAKTAVDWSRLGVVTRYSTDYLQKDWIVSDMTKTISFLREDKSAGADVYTLVTGKRLKNDDAYKQISLTFKDDETARLLRLDVRAYDQGVAFRYVLPEASLFFHKLVEEKTSFNIGLGGTHWGQPYDFVTMYHPSYETIYSDRPTGTPVGEKDGTGWGFPSLLQKNGVWILLHEAGLDDTFQGSHLEPTAPNGVYTVAPPLADEALGNGLNEPAATLPWTMPWRFMVVGDKLSDIVQSNLVFDLSPPSKIADTSWIKPGLVGWNWWSDHASGTDLAKLKKFIDLSAEMGWPYTLIDANWNKAGAQPMEDLVAYAKSKGVGLIFWYNSGGRHNYVSEEPRNLMDDRMIRRAEFAKLEKLGVKGVKVDFWQSDKQDTIRLYTELMDDAAEFHLLCDFHGSTVQRGWQRTWPNLMSMEAVAGAEFYTFPSDYDYTRLAPRQNTILPFTRNVVGSMDYTPVDFSQQVVKRVTTNAHEAALAVIFESGLQHLSDKLASYLSLPPDWRTYLSHVPTVWDETRLLAGAPGQEVVLARRSGARWYVAGINGEDKTKTVKFDLSKVKGIGAKALLLYDDGKGGFASAPWAADKGKSASQTLLPYGGFVLIFGG
jgi:alpha-glucosidase